MPVVSMERVRDQVRSSFWVVPTLCAVAAVVAGIGLVALDRLVGDFRSVFLFPGPPEGARSFLSAIISAMISFTGLVFSITVVVLVLSSGQFSPRILRNFLRDRTIQWALGIFVATFVYAMTVIRTVLGSEGGPFVPRIAVTVAFLLVLGSVGVFIVYINHIANMIRVSSIITSIGERSSALLERRWPAESPPQPPAPELPRSATVVANRRPGVVVSVNEAAITEYAARADLIVALVPRVGDYVPTHAPLLQVYGDDGTDSESAGCLLGWVALDHERTMEQDLAFGFRQLVDIAEKALSPGVNDPTTACQAIDAMHDLLRRLAGRSLPCGRFTDSEGRVRLIVPQYEFTDFLRVAVAEVWHYGSESTQVPERLRTMLRDLESAARPEHRSAVRCWLAVVAQCGPQPPGVP